MIWVAVVVGLVILSGPLSGVASAHATLIESTPGNDEVVPESPSKVTLRFDEGVTTDDDGLRVFGPDGDRADRGAPAVSDDGRTLSVGLDDAGIGTYTVSYRVLSDDGHVIPGSYVYHVKQRTGSAGVEQEESGASVASVVGGVGRWIGFAGALLAGGVLAVTLLVDRRRVHAGPALAASRRLLLPAAAAALFGTGLGLLGSAAELSGRSMPDALSTIPDYVSSSRPGTVAGLRVVVALVLVIAVVGGPLLRRAPALATVGILATLALPSFGGHAMANSPAPVAVFADVIHLLAASAWVGGLAVIVLTWSAGTATASGATERAGAGQAGLTSLGAAAAVGIESEDGGAPADGGASGGDADLRERLRRFSRLAVIVAPLTIAAGSVNAWLQTQSIDALTDTRFGKLVLAKAAGAAALVAFGWVHRRWIADAARGVARMASSLRFELVIGLAVLAVTAVLVDTRPGVDTVSEPVQIVRQAGNTTIRTLVTPARSGPNEVHLYFLARDGSLTNVDATELKVSTEGIEPRRVRLTPISPSHASAQGVQLTSGVWTFDLTVVVEGTPASTSFEVSVQ